MTVTGARALGLVLSLVQVKLAVMYLGPTGYGLLVTATLFVNSFGAWTELGMGNVVVRRVSGRGMDLRHQVGLAMTVSLLIVVPMVLVVNIVSHFMYSEQPMVRLGVAILSAGLLATAWATRFTPVAQVHSRFGHYAAADLAGRILSLVLISITIATGQGLVWFFVAQLMVPVGQMIAMSRLGTLIGGFKPVWSPREMWGLLRETLPMTYISLIGVLYFTVDGVLLSKLSTPDQVGAYGLAYKTVGNFTIVSASIAAVVAAKFAAEAAVASEQFAGTVKQSLKTVLIVAAPLAILVGGIAPDLIVIVGSSAMVDIASRPLALVSVGVGIGMISAILSSALIADYQQRTLTILNTVNLFVNIALNVVLIPRHGAAGAGMSLIVSEALGLLVCGVLMARRYGGYLPTSALIRLVPALALGLVAETVLEAHWLVRVLGVGLAYGIGLLLFRVIQLQEVKRMLARQR